MLAAAAFYWSIRQGFTVLNPGSHCMRGYNWGERVLRILGCLVYKRNSEHDGWTLTTLLLDSRIVARCTGWCNAINEPIPTVGKPQASFRTFRGGAMLPSRVSHLLSQALSTPVSVDVTAVRIIVRATHPAVKAIPTAVPSALPSVRVDVKAVRVVVPGALRPVRVDVEAVRVVVPGVLRPVRVDVEAIRVVVPGGLYPVKAVPGIVPSALRKPLCVDTKVVPRVRSTKVVWLIRRLILSSCG